MESGWTMLEPKQVSGKRWRIRPEFPLMVELPGGEFIQGETKDDKFANDTERPAHFVRIAPGLSLGCFPVTVEEFRRYKPTHAPADPDNLPVVGVSWHDAREYCSWLRDTAGHDFRLPSESEWEYACRAGARDPFVCGNDITPAEANFYYDESGQRVGLGYRVPVGSYAPNAFGLYDCHGNVCEWVADTWHPNYLGAPGDGSPWVEPEDGQRVVRGGAWDYLPRLLRCAWRDWRAMDQKTDNIGFRVAACAGARSA
jgi:formylglycine-generating enzyme required for sulfatase activity